MNNELMSESELEKIMKNYLKQTMRELCSLGKNPNTQWEYIRMEYPPYDRFFMWILKGKPENTYYSICTGLYHGKWYIYNNKCFDENINIKIYPGHVEFIEESKFPLFNKDVMYGLYLKIKEAVDEGNKTDHYINIIFGEIFHDDNGVAYIKGPWTDR